MQLTEPRKVKKNSVVLIRNIANESKREPMKFARVLKINDSRDEAQRILTLTYNNIKKRKDGNWTGTPISVERSINDVIPIDNALNESMLSPSVLEKEKHIADDEKVNETDENTIDDGNEVVNGNEDENIDEEVNDEKKEDTDEQYTEKEITRTVEGDNKQTRKSERIKKQRFEIHPDDIGDNDDEKDKNYK